MTTITEHPDAQVFTLSGGAIMIFYPSEKLVRVFKLGARKPEIHKNVISCKPSLDRMTMDLLTEEPVVIAPPPIVAIKKVAPPPQPVIVQQLLPVVVSSTSSGHAHRHFSTDPDPEQILGYVLSLDHNGNCKIHHKRGHRGAVTAFKQKHLEKYGHPGYCQDKCCQNL